MVSLLLLKKKSDVDIDDVQLSDSESVESLNKTGNFLNGTVNLNLIFLKWFWMIQKYLMLKF